MQFKIEPVAVFPTMATNIVFDVVKVHVGNSASAEFTLRDDNAIVLVNGTATITGEAYANWGTDDSYVYDTMITTLGLVKVVPEVVIPVVTPEAFV